MSCVVICVVLILIGLKIYVKLTTGWCRSQVCLVGKTVIITGANTGIGFYTAIDLAKRGARIILACRNKERAIEAREKIISETENNNIVIKTVDFASLQSVRKFADEIKETEKRLDILVNNAGCAGLGDTKSQDGLNLVMQVNYFAPFLLTKLLLDLLLQTENSRIVNVSALTAKFVKLDLDKFSKYAVGVSKLCNIMFTIELANRLKGTTVTTYSLHPGVVATEIYRRMPNIIRRITNLTTKVFFKSSEEGAQTSIHCSVAQGIEKFSGEHFHDCHVVKRYKSCEDTFMAKKLWDKTEDIISQATKS